MFVVSKSAHREDKSRGLIEESADPIHRGLVSFRLRPKNLLHRLRFRL